MEGPQEKSCCFTGHRPGEKLPAEAAVRRLLRQELQNALEDGYTRFISGMARGFVIWAAEEVVRLRVDHAQLRLVCAVPYPGFEKGWKKEWRNRFDQLLDQADETVFVNRSRLHGGVYQQRNRWMVEQSQRVIALYAGGPGGTWNTVHLCLKAGVELRLLRLPDRP